MKTRIAISILTRWCALGVFLLVPIWYRFPDVASFFNDLYVVHFAMFQLMLGTIALWVLSGFQGFKRLFENHWQVLALWFLLCLALWMYVSGAWAFMRNTHPELATNASLQFMVVCLFLIVCAAIEITPRECAFVLITGLVWTSLLVAGQVALQGAVGGVFTLLGEFPLSQSRQGLSYLQVGDFLWLRPYGLLPHPNILAGFLSAALFASFALVMTLKTRFWLVLNTLILLGGTWAFLLTFSRSAWLGAAAGGIVLIGYLLWYGYGLRRLFVITILLTGAGVLFMVLYYPLVLARAGVGAEAPEQHSIGERTILINAALEVINQTPILGVGAGNFPWRASYLLFEQDIPMRGDHVHNVYLTVLAETGLVGFILFSLATGAGIIAIVRQIRRNDESKLIRVSFLGAFVCFLVIGFFDHYLITLIQFQTLWWGMLIIGAAPAHSVSIRSMLESA